MWRKRHTGIWTRTGKVSASSALGGGGGGSSNPIVALSPVFYWRADDDPTESAAALTSIVDQSGNENDLANNGGNNATMTAGKEGTNNRRYFKAPTGNVTCEYEATGIVTALSTEATLMVATYFDASVPAGGTHVLLQSHLERFKIQLDQNNDDIESYSNTIGGFGNIVGVTPSGMYILAARFKSNAAANTGHQLFINSTTAADTEAASNDATIGAGAGDTAVTFLNDRGNDQEICEAAVWDSALSDADLATAMAAMATYYGVTLT